MEIFNPVKYSKKLAILSRQQNTYDRSKSILFLFRQSFYARLKLKLRR